MKLEVQKNKFNLLDLDYEMMQTVLNGIICEKSRLGEKLSYLTTCLLKSNFQEDNEEIKVQIDYLTSKKDHLNEIIENLKTTLENIEI